MTQRVWDVTMVPRMNMNIRHPVTLLGMELVSLADLHDHRKIIAASTKMTKRKERGRKELL